jgi:hypothetical protein
MKTKGAPERNLPRVPVLRRAMGRVAKGGAGVVLLAAALVMSAAAPAAARVGVGIYVGGPAWGYPAPYGGYPYPYYAPYAPPYPSAYPYVPPPGWVPGRWEWRYDPWGRRYRVWVPPHLR